MSQISFKYRISLYFIMQISFKYFLYFQKYEFLFLYFSKYEFLFFEFYFSKVKISSGNFKIF